MINKNIQVWRGNETPPTVYHLWLKEDDMLYSYKDSEWTPISVPDTYDGLYSKILNFTQKIPEQVSADELIYDRQTLATMAIGEVTIVLPYESTWQFAIYTTFVTSGSIIVDGESYSIKPKMVFQQSNTNIIKFFATNYVWLNEIKIDEILMTVPTHISQLNNDSKHISGTVNNETLILKI